MRKWIIVLIVLILVGGGGTYWYKENKAHAKQSTNVIIPTATVQKGTLESDVSGSGSLSATVDEDVKADSPQTIYAIEVKEGQKVKKGQHLVEYNNGTYLDAPDSGTVTAINVYDNTNVQAGTAICHITSYDNLSTVISVDELDIPKVKIGQTANVTVNAYPDQAFTGKVTAIADTGTDTNGVSSFDVTLHLDQSKNLKPGMTTSANIVTAVKKNTLYVPVSAIHKQGTNTYVLVESGNSNSSQSSQQSSSQQSSNQQGSYSRRNRSYGGGRWRMAAGNSNAQQVTVKTGINNDNYIEITSGLQEGQIVELPPITTNSNSSSSGQTNKGGFGMYGGMGGYGGGGFGRNFGGGSFSRGNSSSSGASRGGGN